MGVGALGLASSESPLPSPFLGAHTQELVQVTPTSVTSAIITHTCFSDGRVKQTETRTSP